MEVLRIFSGGFWIARAVTDLCNTASASASSVNTYINYDGILSALLPEWSGDIDAFGVNWG